MITNTDDIIDSRDVEDRIEELESGCLELDEDEYAELVQLRQLKWDCEFYVTDWKYGATLIHNMYFKEYARDFAEDIHGEITGWPWCCIDWNEAANELKMDFTEIDFGGQPYWVR